MFGRFQNIEDQTKNNFLTYLSTLFHILNHIQNMSCPKPFGRVQNNLAESKIILDSSKGQGISNLKVAKSGKDECFIWTYKPNTNVI